MTLEEKGIMREPEAEIEVDFGTDANTQPPPSSSSGDRMDLHQDTANGTSSNSRKATANGSSHKRHGPALSSSGGVEPTSKKRAPYTSRACDACRRRKGRCSGDHPCTYCVARSLDCTGLDALSGRLSTPTSTPTALPMPPTRASVSTAGASSASAVMETVPKLAEPQSALASTAEARQSATTIDERTLSSLSDMVSSLQQQVSTLTSKMQFMEQGSHRHTQAHFNCHPHYLPQSPRLDSTPIGGSRARLRNSNPPTVTSDAMAIDIETSPRQHSAKRGAHRRRFFGPTSPDYSLNVAQHRLYQGELPHRPGGIGPAMDNGHDRPEDSESIYSPNEDEDDEPEEDGSASAQAPAREMAKLTGFTRLCTKEDSIRLATVYQEVFGHFHPILDIDAVTGQIASWYGETSMGRTSNGGELKQEESSAADTIVKPPEDESSLLMMNLVLAIALCAEPTSDVDVAKAIYTYCRDTINRKLASPSPSIKHVVIAHLVGVYHFFRDDARFSWRMCGLAGNVLLELGLHSREIPEHMLDSGYTKGNIVAIICTTIVLDRQWSASTGLPTHFQESHFHNTMKSSVESPYLKAMVAFMAISDKFTGLISRYATASHSYEEDDTFEILNLQIEQWRKNSVGEYNMTQHGLWRSIPISRIPSWAILLNLRANAAHSMLLRPFFFASKPTEASKKNIEPALRLSSDSIDILFSMDKTTDVYRKQLPFYIHLLVSACALMALVIAHVTEHHDALAAHLPEDFADTVAKSFRKALALTTAYSRSSRASRKLWKRLVHIQEPLVRLGILSRETQVTVGNSDGAVSRGEQQRPSQQRRSQQTQSPGQQQQRQQQQQPVQQTPSRPEQVGGWNSNWTTNDGSYSTMQQGGRPPMQPANVGPEQSSTNGNSQLQYQHQHAPDQFVHNMSAMPATLGMPGPHVDGAPPGSSGMIPFGAGGTIFAEWPIVDGHHFFSHGDMLYRGEQ